MSMSSNDKKASCAVCGTKIDESRLEIHHIRPIKDGGDSSPENVIHICPNCHREIHTTNNNRLAGAGLGGAILGASLAGPAGALVGGFVGLLMGDSVNKSKTPENKGDTDG
ncbi:TPA: HNH endonuclease [Vibrio parahaemolyticus]|nr:HNH endonuclease [Vibrio parahaemolyticus]HCG8053653.1 HNH endonuclease [Vibrio parahaemolyticus]HCG8069110.1 HNH endonuclease [Vibrio parahaemolyticus]HCH0777890.1 HNH endonuclease [Vibrio parahaemolyticus]